MKATADTKQGARVIRTSGATQLAHTEFASPTPSWVLHPRYRGPNHVTCAVKLKRGEEMGGSSKMDNQPVAVITGITHGIVSGTRARARRAPDTPW